MSITTILWTYELKNFSEQFNVLKVDYDGINPMEKFSGTITELTLKNYHTWGCPVYVLDARLQGNKYGPPKWEYRSHEVIYLFHSPFNALSVALVLNPTTGNVSLQFYVVIDDEFPTVPCTR